MSYCKIFGALALASTLLTPPASAQTADASKYPDLSGEWHGTGTRWPKDPPLTPEYQKIWEANQADHSDGGSPTADLPAARHAAADGRVRADGNRDHAEDHLLLDRAHP